MAFYIAALAHALVPLALASALLPVMRGDRETGGGSGRLAIGVGLAAGVVAVAIAASRAREAEAGTWVHALTLAVILAALVVLLLRALPLRSVVSGALLEGTAALLLAALAARGLYAAWLGTVDQSLTATTVVNTELVVNCAAILIALAALAALSAITGRVARLAGGSAALVALAVLLVMEAVTSSAAAMLGLLQLDLITVTAGRISYVAKVSLVAPWVTYAELGLVLVLAGVAFARRARAPARDPKLPPQLRVARRKQLARALGERRWRQGLAAVSAFLLVTLLYQDLYASLPPSLSPATPVAPDQAGEIRIPIEEVKDGSLHRFAYIASDGHRIRFFLINRYDQEHVHIGVVYDACMICGDDGYIQNGEEIICIACNVRIFKPSIGKPGGCNPIPLVHAVRDGAIVIRAQELDKGARYFSEVVEIEVTDPVSGEALINLEAPFQYEYGGRTFFFGSEESYDAFRASPEAYTQGQEARHLRVQGHQDREI